MRNNHPLNTFKYCPRCGSRHFEVNDFKSKRCTDCGFEYYMNASASVAAFIFNKKGELLLTERAFEPSKGMRDLPGGFVDLNETAEEALGRELKEELNIEIVNAHYLFSIPNHYEYSEFTIHTLDLFFKADISGTILCNDDVASAKFIPLNQIVIKQIGLSSIKQAIKHYLEFNKKIKI